MDNQLKTSILLFFLIFSVQSIEATSYYSNPVNGSMNNDGLSKNTAWGSLEAIFAAKKKFQAGDIIYLMSGQHGQPNIIGANNGTNTDYVTITALSDETPKIAALSIESSDYWTFNNIIFTSDGTGGNFTKSYMFSTKADVDYIKIENCTFYSAESSASWTKADWYSNAKDAVILRGTNSVFNNNTIKNTYFALQIAGDYAEIKNNLIDNFGADAIRALGSHALYEGNTIRDAYVEDYGVNHDDGIQMYDADNISGGIITDVMIRNNKIFNFSDPITQSMVDDKLVGYSMQGIIITDGHIENSIVENNLVVSDHYHGITLVGSNNCRVQNNTVLKTPLSYNPTSDAIPWVQFKVDKNGNECQNSIIRNNVTTKLTPWTYDNGINMLAENNLVVAIADYDSYFTDSKNFDFTLIETSPAIDAGLNIDLPNTDLDGNTRMVGATVDCGAYEYQGTSDQIPPTIISAGDTYYNDEISLTFSESITKESAENTANYSLNNYATVSGAILSTDNKTVTLTTSALTENTLYTVTANNVEDYAGNKAVNTSGTFKYLCNISHASTFQNDQWGYNPPENAFDGDFNTKWAANGTQWIEYAFCSQQTITSVDIAFGFGDERKYSFILEVSADGRNYSQIYTGTSSGSSTSLESFDFNDVTAKYIRITGSGSNVNAWNNYVEIKINTATTSGNTAPILAEIGNQTVNEGATKDIVLSASDSDGDALTFTISGNPTWATLSDNGDGTAKLSLAPQSGDAGTYDNIIVTVSDGMDTDTDTISITVNPNTTPVLDAIGNQTVNEGATKDIVLSASDSDGDALTFTISGNPTWTTLSDNGDGTAKLSLAPQSGDAGTYDNIVIAVSDGMDTDTDTISINVSGTTGIDKITDSRLNVYPNPAPNSKFTISMNGFEGKITIRIMNLSGKILFMNEVSSGSKTYQPSIHLPEGSYIIIFENDNSRIFKKLLVK